MENNKLFKGIMPALITPVNEDGSLREKSVRKMIDAHLENGVAGFYICGSTGEGPALSEKTRMDMARVCVDQVKGTGAVIIDHVGAPDALSAVRMARDAEKVGCNAISSVPPTFYYSYGKNEIFNYYRTLNENCGLPLLVYATSMFGSEDLTPFVERLMTLPNVIGLKFTRTNYFEMRKILELNGGNINVINGPDEMLVLGLTMGADAGIGSTYNVMSKQYVKLYNNFQKGDFESARNMQFKINHVIDVLLHHELLSAIKWILTRKGFDAGNAVFPGKRFTEEEENNLRKALDEIHYFEEF